MERDNGEDGADEIGDFGDDYDVLGDALQLLGAVAGGDRDDRAFPGADLLDIVHVLREDGVVGRDEDRRQIGADEGDDAVLQFRARMTFGEEIGDFF